MEHKQKKLTLCPLGSSEGYLTAGSSPFFTGGELWMDARFRGSCVVGRLQLSGHRRGDEARFRGAGVGSSHVMSCSYRETHQRARLTPALKSPAISQSKAIALLSATFSSSNWSLSYSTTLSSANTWLSADL